MIVVRGVMWTGGHETDPPPASLATAAACGGEEAAGRTGGLRCFFCRGSRRVRAEGGSGWPVRVGGEERLTLLLLGSEGGSSGSVERMDGWRGSHQWSTIL